MAPRLRRQDSNLGAPRPFPDSPPATAPSRQFPGGSLGSAAINSAGAAIDPVEVSLGVDQRAQLATGSIALGFGSPLSLKADLKAKQLNLDSLLRRKDEDGVPPARALATLASAFAPFRALSSSPLRASVNFSAPSGELGAQPLADLSLDAELAPGAQLKTRFEIALPGLSRLQAEGDWDLGPAPQFAGTLDAAIGEAQPLSAWASQGAPAFADRLAALAETFPYRTASLQSAIKISGVGFSAHDVRLTLDRSTLDGSLAWTRAVGGDAARVYMDLRSDFPRCRRTSQFCVRGRAAWRRRSLVVARSRFLACRESRRGGGRERPARAESFEDRQGRFPRAIDNR